MIKIALLISACTTALAVITEWLEGERKKHQRAMFIHDRYYEHELCIRHLIAITKGDEK